MWVYAVFVHFIGPKVACLVLLMITQWYIFKIWGIVLVCCGDSVDLLTKVDT